MKYKILFLTITFFIFTFNLYSNTIKVPDNYTSITNALKYVSNGDTIIITDSGLYYESINITGKTNLTIQGESGKDKPTIWLSSSANYVINLNFDTENITLENLNIISKSNCYGGIEINSSFNLIINCEIKSENPITSMQGIQIQDGQFNKIVSCVISDFEVGIYSYGQDTYIFYNTIYKCQTGIYLYDNGGSCFVYNNTIVDCTMEGIKAENSANNLDLDLKNNIMYDSHHNLYLDQTGGSLNVESGHNFYNNLYENGINMFNDYSRFEGEPGFVDYGKWDFNLLLHSPCIDNGEDIIYESFGFRFLDDMVCGKARDIGAYELEYKIEPPLPPKSEYIELSANNLTIGKETKITLKDLRLINLENVYIKAVIFDLKGKLIKNLFDQNVAPANNVTLSWNGKDSNGEYVGAGVYLLKVHMGSINKTRKIFFVP